MKALPAIARYMRLPEEQLRFPIELIQQGYEPNYLAMYRPDELGGIDVETLARLKRALEYETSLAAHKEKVLATMERDNQSSESAQQVIEECTSVSQVDAIVRSIRNKKSARTHAEEFPVVERLGQALLVYQGETPTDLSAWAAEQAGVPLEEADTALQQTKRWLQLLLSEDPKLTLQLQRAILKSAVVSLSILPEPAKGDESEVDAAGVVASKPDVVIDAISPSQESPDESSITSSEPVVESVVESNAVGELQESDTVQPDSGSEVAASAEAEVAASAEQATTVAPLIEQFHKGRKQTKALRTKSLSDKQLSPRQRRRRWLRHILESYSKLKKPLRNLTPYQILMIARGIRSRIVDLNFQQDMRSLVQACRESLCPGRHPMHGVLMEIAESGLKELILPRLHQDVLAILEEDAHQELIEASVLHLQNNLLQRPVRGHRILVIDAVGVKTAAISIVDVAGNVVATAEIPCNSSKPDVVAQNMSLLGQLVHQYRVSLIVLTNGPARRYLMPAVVELLKQSTEGSLYWTLVDRSGCDAYTQSRTSLVELPRISRRHRAAVWLAWRLQDPLRQILKIDPSRLRLGSYQRELPQAELERALQESVSATITKAGVDALSVDAEVLKRIPGMTEEAAERVAEERQKGTIANREALMKVLREVLTEMQARQAIGFLRIYGSSNPLDGSIIHPDDYRLAERLIAHASFALPPSAPEAWEKPDYEKIAAAKAAVAGLSLESVLTEDAASSAAAPKVEINPDFGKLDTEPADSSPEPTLEIAGDESTESVAEEAAVSIAEPAAPTSEAESESQEPEAIGDAVSSEASTEAAATSNSSVPAERSLAEAPTEPMARPELSVDAEKLARSWSVGRAKLRSVAACLQHPFADVREFRYPVPLRSQVPSLEQLPQGTMLSALVVGVADFGVFVELGPDCSGLVHISRLASDFVEDPHMFVQIGDVIPIWVVQVDDKRKRVAVNAIPPGTVERKRESMEERSKEHSPASRPSGRGSDRNERSASGQAPRSGGARGGESNAGARDSGKRRGGPNDRGRGGFAGKGNANRDRNTSNESSSTARKPVRIDKPQPQKPITEAMQQGKEPLRSFSDLMQFMQKDKTPTNANEASVIGIDPIPSSDAESISSESSTSVATEGDATGEAQRLPTDANTTA
jgi:uncharacterized protein